MSWDTWVTPNTAGKPLGWMSDKDWEETVRVLKQYGGVTTPLEASAALHQRASSRPAPNSFRRSRNKRGAAELADRSIQNMLTLNDRELLTRRSRGCHPMDC